MTQQAEVQGHSPIGEHEGEHGHTVTVTIDGVPKKIQAKTYRVSELKEVLGVPPEKELDEVIEGVLHPLDDNKDIKIKGGEVFVSHARTGGSS